MKINAVPTQEVVRSIDETVNSDREIVAVNTEEYQLALGADGLITVMVEDLSSGCYKLYGTNSEGVRKTIESGDVTVWCTREERYFNPVDANDNKLVIKEIMIYPSGGLLYYKVENFVPAEGLPEINDWDIIYSRRGLR